MTRSSALRSFPPTPDTALHRFGASHNVERHAAYLGAHRYDRHSHDEFSVILLTAGQKTLRVGRKTYEVQPGQIVLIPPGESHDCEPLRGMDWSHRCWYLSPSLVAEFLGPVHMANEPPGFQPVLAAPVLAQRLIKSHAASTAAGASDQQFALLSQALRLSVSGPQGAGPVRSKARIEAYIAALRQAPAAPLDLEFLADLGGVTRYQVIRDFKAIYAMTPGNFLRDLRLKQSRKMLRQDISLVDLSQALGFSDQSHFSRSFKSAYGVSPSAYRRTMNGAF